MKILPLALDKPAIILSTLCVLHCLALPLLTVLLPSLAILPLNQEMFHVAMVICVLPTSIYAITLGCKKHRKLSIAYTTVLGLIALVAAVVYGESHLGEVGEKLLTTFGAVVIASAHIRNYKLCQQSECCSD